MASACVRASLRDRLRQETAGAHARLEARLPLLDGSLDRPGYTRVLRAMLGVYRPLERRLRAVSIEGLDPGLDRKADWLARDLVALGHDHEAILAVPDCATLPELHSSASAIGCRYVLEGATLGGAIIARAVVPALGLEAGGARFFRGYGPRTRERWDRFVGLLDAWGRAHEHEQVAAVVTARATFTTFERWLGERGVLR